jgi:hypothetical protein
MTVEEAEWHKTVKARNAVREAQSVPTIGVSTSCIGHGKREGSVYSFYIEEPIYGQFSRGMIWGGSGNCGLVAAGYPVPVKWTPNMKVKVRWNRPIKGEDNWIEKTTAILPYDKVGNLYVHFFPNDEVRVVVSPVGALNPNHPIPPTATEPPPEPD